MTAPDLLNSTTAAAADGWQIHVHRVPDVLRPYVRSIHGYEEFGCPAIARKMMPVGFVPLILVIDRGFTEHDTTSGAFLRRLPRRWEEPISSSAASAAAAVSNPVALNPPTKSQNRSTPGMI